MYIDRVAVIHAQECILSHAGTVMAFGLTFWRAVRSSFRKGQMFSPFLPYHFHAFLSCFWTIFRHLARYLLTLRGRFHIFKNRLYVAIYSCNMLFQLCDIPNLNKRLDLLLAIMDFPITYEDLEPVSIPMTRCAFVWWPSEMSAGLASLCFHDYINYIRSYAAVTKHPLF